MFVIYVWKYYLKKYLLTLILIIKLYKELLVRLSATDSFPIDYKVNLTALDPEKDEPIILSWNISFLIYNFIYF